MLYDYQQDCLAAIEAAFGVSDKQLIQLPTGGGKTYVFLHYLRAHSKKALIICPSRDLVEQIEDSATMLNVHDQIKVVTTAWLQFPKNRAEVYAEKYDTIVIDEAHHAQSMTYHRFLKDIPYKYRLLGCTATPERLDGLSLLEIFGQLTFSLKLIDLINLGYLCDVEAYRIKTECTLSTSRMRRGDFLASELKKLNVASRNELIFKTYDEYCKDKKTLIFCLNIEHAEQIAAHFKNAGLPAACVHGGMGKHYRQKILGQFRSGKIQILTNCQLLTEGFDEASIEALIIARPTASKGLYAQMVGRVVRKHPGKAVGYLYELTDNNYNICTFDTLTGKSFQGHYQYPQHARLTQIIKETENLTLDDYILLSESIDLLGEEDFDAPDDDELITLEEALDLKLGSMELIKRNISEFTVLKRTLEDWLSWDVRKITPSLLKVKVNDMLNEIVSVGGNGGKGGRQSRQSPSTILRKIRILSSVYSHLIDKGFYLLNPTTRIMGILKTKIKENKE